MAVGLKHLEAPLKPNQLYHYGLNRRALLSTLAVLPTLVGLRPILARAQGQTDALPSWNDGATKRQSPTSCPGSLSRVDLILCPLPNVLQCSIMTAPCGWSSQCMSSLHLRSIA